MLNRTKVLKDLQEVVQTLFIDVQQDRNKACRVWRKICSDAFFYDYVAGRDWPFIVPRWNQDEKLDSVIDVSRESLDSYTVFAVDGSQVYPDRHQGIACYLINIGTAILRYDEVSSVDFHSDPYLMLGALHDDLDTFDGGAQTPDIVNCQRTDYELKAGVEKGKELEKTAVFLFDGSLIFWHLDSKDPVVKKTFFTNYITHLEDYYRYKIIHAGYISLTKSRELVNLLRVAFEIPGYAKKNSIDFVQLQNLVDSDIVSSFLQPNQRTILFENRSKIVEQYPRHLRPYFFYLNNGSEIVRIEIPAWIAASEKAIKWITRIILDQSDKGQGYPVCLAEAHEQAVVKHIDRDFFFHSIQKLAIHNDQMYSMSQKSIQKRGIGV